ncbi:MAG: carbamoyl-phosphate synthase small subunit, partial [Betaproteobacteria bacterium]|nr:carbamoyl-phosphate synthase small subunit [Betaproteobacteria bacterium]
MRPPAILALADGTIFRGQSIGAEGLASGEVVFNTAITGYQEILTDPSYCRQIVTLTYPHIGNTGVNSEDEESDGIYASGLVVRDCPPRVSSWRARQALPDYLGGHGTVAIAGIDTRRLTRILREKGAQSGCLLALPAGAALGEADVARAVAAASEFPGLTGMDLAKVVSTRSRYEWTEGCWRLGEGFRRQRTARFHVAAYDYG